MFCYFLLNCKSYSHFFSKKFQNICVSLDVNFNESLNNDVVSFEQLGPDIFLMSQTYAVSTHQQHLIGVLLMSTTNVCFHSEIRKILSRAMNQYTILKHITLQNNLFFLFLKRN